MKKKINNFDNNNDRHMHAYPLRQENRDISQAYLEATVYNTHRVTRPVYGLAGSATEWGVTNLELRASADRVNQDLHRTQHRLNQHAQQVERVWKNRVRHRWRVLINAAAILEKKADLYHALCEYLGDRTLRLNGICQPPAYVNIWKRIIRKIWNEKDDVVQRLFDVVEFINNILELLLRILNTQNVSAAAAGAAAVVIANKLGNLYQKEQIEIVPEAPTEAPATVLLQ